jgi:hypothetical protein
VANSYLGSIKINIDGKYYILFLLINVCVGERGKRKTRFGYFMEFNFVGSFGGG